MAPLGWSGGSQFSSIVLPFGSPITVSMCGGEGAGGVAMEGLVEWKCKENAHTAESCDL